MRHLPHGCLLDYRLAILFVYLIFNYFNQKTGIKSFKQSINKSEVLRYGENPHQEGVFYGDLNGLFNQLNGKAISYNNLVDLEAALALINEF